MRVHYIASMLLEGNKLPVVMSVITDSADKAYCELRKAFCAVVGEKATTSDMYIVSILASDDDTLPDDMVVEHLVNIDQP